MNEAPSPADSEESFISGRDDAAAPVDPNTPIVARYGSYYRNTRFILAAILFVMAGWFAYDGWVRYPADNERFAALGQQIK